MTIKKKLGEKVVNASVELGMYIVKEMANLTLTKNGNTTLREFIKVLDEYEKRASVRKRL